MFIVNNRKFFFVLSGLLVAGSILSVWMYGFNLGIDFKGGSLLELQYPVYNRPAIEKVKNELNKLDLGIYSIIPAGVDGNEAFCCPKYILKTKSLTLEEKTEVLKAMDPEKLGQAQEIRFNSIGPTVGAQLKHKAVVAIIVVIICIVLFITFAFRKVSYPVASWKYGLATIVALFHDVIIPTGVFVIWTHYHGGEIDLLFVTALLAILGYSVHDTIVVFDRVRENLKSSHLEARLPSDGFEQIVGASVTQTFGRSINTSLTIFLALVALYFLGGTSTRDFAFVLLIGIITGTYSSIFVASPLLVTLEKLQK